MAIVRALLDLGAEATFLTENLAQFLRLAKVKEPTRIEGLGDIRTAAKYTVRLTSDHSRVILHNYRPPR